MTEREDHRPSHTAHMTGQQYAAAEQRMAEAMRQAVHKMELRKWSVELAVKIAGPADAMKVAAAIYHFVTAPAAEIKVTLTE